MVKTFIQEVFNPARLAALRRLGLLDTPAEDAFDRLGAVAAKLLKTPIALVTLVDDTRQFFKSCRGLPEPWATWRYTPLSHSFCQHVLTSSEPLIVSDARQDPRFVENLGIRELGIIAYLGIPLKLNTGEVLGSFCVIDTKPRVWTEDHISNLTTLAGSVMTEIELRSEIRHKQTALEEVEALNRELSKKAAQLEVARTDLEAFNHSLFHDLRSPVRSVSVFAHLLHQSGCTMMNNVQCVDYLNRISDSAGRIQHILEGLTTLFGMTHAEMRIEDVNLTDIAEKILGALQASAPERNVAVRIAPGLSARADSHLVQVALENLLHNAWKFTGKTPETVIEVGERIENGEHIYFVRDNGAGFETSSASKLFVPFARLHSPREFAGTGLGLTTVKRIIDRHGGRIWAESEPGKGSIFHFTLEGTPDEQTVLSA